MKAIYTLNFKSINLADLEKVSFYLNIVFLGNYVCIQIHTYIFLMLRFQAKQILSIVNP